MKNLDPESYYRLLGELVATQPKFELGADNDEVQIWLGRVNALLEAGGHVNEAIDVRVAVSATLNTTAHDAAVRTIRGALFRALAKAELAAPVEAQGAFVPVGASFSALMAVSKVVERSRQNVMVVDPYADITVLSDFGILVPEQVTLRVLSDSATVKPTLHPAAQQWARQYGVNRPLQVRLAPPRSLHDRLIIIDDKDAWVLTQSLKDFAARSPGSLLRVDPETAALKVAAYDGIWQAAAVI